MIRSFIAESAVKMERYHGQQVPRVQLGLAKQKRRNQMFQKFAQFVGNNEEIFYVFVAFGAGTVAAGVLIALVSLF